MKTQKVKIKKMSISIPEYYSRVDSMPEDPPDSHAFMVQSKNAVCFVLVYQDSIEKAMPRNQKEVIKGIRKCMAENQGLIQVEAGDDFVYTIVKTLKDPGVQYILTLQRFFDDRILHIQAFFDETGMTGIRDTMVFTYCSQQGIIGKGENMSAGWVCDPYDPSVKTGALMNLSEKEEYDQKFPGFPLSMCRELVKTVLDS